MTVTWLLLATLAADGEVLGYVESRGYGLFGQADDLDALSPFIDFGARGLQPSEHWSAIARLRPTAKLHLTEESSVVATALAQARYGYFTSDPEAVDDVATIERLYLTLSRGPVDLVAGKQLISWGSGLLANPTDVFTQKPVGDLSAELPGVWAARATFGVSDEANLHLAAAVDERRCCDAILLTRYDQTFGTTDAALTLAYTRGNEQLVTGIDVKGELELGLWAEAALVFDHSGGAFAEPFLLAELGADYSFGDLYLAVEWIHQGNGTGGAWQGPTRQPPRYLIRSASGSEWGEQALLGTNYALLLLRYTFSTTLTAQWLNLLNVRDPSGTSVLQGIWQAADWLELTLGVQGNYGEPGGEFNLRTPDLPVLPPALRDVRLQPAVITWLWARSYF